MTFVIISILVIVTLGWLSWRVAHQSAAANAVDLAGRLLALLAGVLVAWAFDTWMGSLFTNFVVELMLAFAMGLVAMALIGWAWRIANKKHHMAERLTEQLSLAPWVDRVAAGAVILSLCLVGLIAIDMTARLLNVGESNPTTAAGTSNLPSSNAPHSPKQNDAVDKAMAEQADFFNRFSAGLQNTKQRFYDMTGADGALRELEAVQAIDRLPDEEKLWLLNQHPDLIRLMDQPSIRRVANNKELMKELSRVADGSVDAIFRIGNHPDMAQLLRDPQIRQLIGQIDAQKMLAQVQRHREAKRHTTAQSPVAASD
jgi:hypothetical protein